MVNGFGSEANRLELSALCINPKRATLPCECTAPDDGPAKLRKPLPWNFRLPYSAAHRLPVRPCTAPESSRPAFPEAARTPWASTSVPAIAISPWQRDRSAHSENEHRSQAPAQGLYLHRRCWHAVQERHHDPARQTGPGHARDIFQTSVESGR